MIRIAIVDDDELALQQINEIIKTKWDDIFIIDLYSESVKFYNDCSKWNYDVIILDIDMPEMTGFELADTVGLLKKSTAIIFISNLEHLVYDSLKFKPFRFVRKSQMSLDVVSALNDFIVEQKRNQDVFVVKTNGMIIPIAVSDIIYFESMGHDIFVKIMDDTKYQLLRERDNNISIKMLTEQFEPKGFIRAHKSYLINYRYIFVIKFSEVILKNNESIIINPHKVGELRERYQRCIMAEGNKI